MRLKNKILMINENTVIKLYQAYEWEDKYDQTEITTLVIDKIMAKLSKTSKPHPLKELFLSDEDRGPFYELVHFTFVTIANYKKTHPTLPNKQQPKQ